LPLQSTRKNEEKCTKAKAFYKGITEKRVVVDTKDDSGIIFFIELIHRRRKSMLREVREMRSREDFFKVFVVFTQCANFKSFGLSNKRFFK